MQNPTLSFKDGLKIAAQAFASTLLASGFSKEGAKSVTGKFVKTASARQSRIEQYTEHFAKIIKPA
jgi:hypothetical protein